MKRALKRLGRALAGPFPVYFDKRFAALHEHIDEAAARNDQLRAEVAALAAQVDGLQLRLDGELQPLEELLTALERGVSRLRDEREPSSR
jgi:hypothetical protein